MFTVLCYDCVNNILLEEPQLYLLPAVAPRRQGRCVSGRCCARKCFTMMAWSLWCGKMFHNLMVCNPLERSRGVYYFVL